MNAQLEPEFWKKKELEDLNEAEWEALCDHCGKCCLHKYADGNKCIFVNSACKNLSLPSCHCRVYAHRFNANCVKVDLRLVEEEPELLPDSCAYKRLFRGEELPEWHPLVSGNPESTKLSGNKLDSSLLIPESELFNRISECGGIPADIFPIEVVDID